MYKIIIAPKALKKLQRISRLHQREAFREILKDIRENPFAGKPLQEELTNRYAYKTGAFRILYTINVKDKIVTILNAGHRATVYIPG